MGQGQRTRDLQEALEVYHILCVCCSEGMEAIKRDPGKFARKVAEKTGKAFGEARYTRKSLQDFFDQSITPMLNEMCFIDLVRVFEQIVFEFVDNASGAIKSAIKKGSKEKYPFYLYAEKFVKGSERDIHNLGDVQKILEDRESGDRNPSDLQKKLTNIVKYRNWLAHGNRFKKEGEPSQPGDLLEIQEILQEVLAQIRPAS